MGNSKSKAAKKDHPPAQQQQSQPAQQQQSQPAQQQLEPWQELAKPAPQPAPPPGPAEPSTDEYLAPGYLVAGRYRPTKLLGQGGFGKTYLGEDLQGEGGEVVIKVLLPQGAQGYTEQDRATFAKEADKLARLGSHPNIPSMLDYFDLGNSLMLIQVVKVRDQQDKVDGDDLWVEAIKNNVIWNEQMVWVFLIQMLKLFDYCHSRANNAGGVIHRDIKPQNIMRRKHDGEFVLIDFGAAKSVNNYLNVTLQQSIGTPGYQAPEINQGQVFFSSDLYSLGATIVFLLARMEPSQMQGGAVNWRSYVKIPVSNELASVLDGLMFPNPQQRFQDAMRVMEYMWFNFEHIWEQYDVTDWQSPSLRVAEKEAEEHRRRKAKKKAKKEAYYRRFQPRPAAATVQQPPPSGQAPTVTPTVVSPTVTPTVVSPTVTPTMVSVNAATEAKETPL